MRQPTFFLLALFALPLPDLTSRVIEPERDDPARLSRQVDLNLLRIHEESLRAIELVAEPWSDRNWKANKGLLLDRYTDDAYVRERGWPRKREYLAGRPASWVLTLPPGRERDARLASLSPVEKYDLLVGTLEGGLADQMAAFLDRELGGRSAFPTWWGLCEGSSAATMYYPEPRRAVSLYSEAYGLEIPFYASDVKGLASLLWSLFNDELLVPEAGSQCRAGGQGCDDSNPGTFHAAVHHFLDRDRAVLVADMDPSPSVWNYPLLRYRERYFRADDRSEGTDPRAVAVSLRSWARDPRRHLRAPDAVYVVGVRNQIWYGVNRADIPLEGDTRRDIQRKELRYELELDANWKIVGGEWLGDDHPDLLWVLPRGLLPNSPGDRLLPPVGTETEGVPRTWAAAARVSAAKVLPLRRVVEMLVQRAAQP